jgi:hypothetical protein
MSERWLSPDEAVAFVRAHTGGSIGLATNTLKLARASGEVRITTPPPVLFIADDGIVDMNMRPGAQLKTGITAEGKPTFYDLALPPAQILISEDDLLDWLNRNPEPAAPNAARMRPASTHEIRTAMFSIANDPANDRPNVKQLAKLVVSRLRAAAAIVSENQVIELADAPEFKALRRPPGKTKRSGG